MLKVARMAHLELNVESGEPCTGTQGSYIGNLYHTGGAYRRVVLTRTKLGSFHAALNDPTTTIEWTRRMAERQEGKDIPLETVAAVGVLRFCWRRRHIDAELAVGGVPSVERVASLAVAHTLDDVERIVPVKHDRFEYNSDGLGIAERDDPGMTLMQALIHLPISPREARTPAYRITSAVGTSALARGMSEKPYVALHGSDNLYLEQIVPLQDLR